jgi:hypothetical protein
MSYDDILAKFRSLSESIHEEVKRINELKAKIALLQPREPKSIKIMERYIREIKKIDSAYQPPANINTLAAQDKINEKYLEVYPP